MFSVSVKAFWKVCSLNTKLLPIFVLDIRRIYQMKNIYNLYLYI